MLEINIKLINIFSTVVRLKYNQSINCDTGYYTKLFFENGMITGAVLIGDTKNAFKIKDMIDSKRDFSREIKEGVNIMHMI